MEVRGRDFHARENSQYKDLVVGKSLESKGEMPTSSSRVKGGVCGGAGGKERKKKEKE